MAPPWCHGGATSFSGGTTDHPGGATTLYGGTTTLYGGTTNLHDGGATIKGGGATIVVGDATKVVGGATIKGGSTTVALPVAPLFNLALQQSLDKVVPPGTCMVCGADNVLQLSDWSIIYFLIDVNIRETDVVKLVYRIAFLWWIKKN